MSKRFIVICYLLIIGLTCCKKEKVTKNHSELVGNWKHYISANEIQYLSIESDGRLIEFLDNKEQRKLNGLTVIIK